MIEVKNVTKRYGDFYAVKDINFSVEEGEFVSIIGPSGCGKSTITNLLLKPEKVDKGEITLNGMNLNYIPFEVLTKKVGFINEKT